MMNSTMYHQTSDSEEVQEKLRENAKNECIEKYGLNVLYNTTPPIYNDSVGWFCPAYWDGIVCWPNTLENTLATALCPSYFVGFDKTFNNATRLCTTGGKWFFNQDLNKTWTDYTRCFGSDQPTVWVDLSDEISRFNSSLIKDYLPLLKTIPRVGYTVSLCTLIVAFTIMFVIKKLHCPRNNLHMNLFASFIFRAFLSLLKDILFVQGVGLPTNLKEKDGKTFFYQDTSSNNWSCKLVTTLWEFFITANYSWILMEGLYLHNLIFRALFTDSSSKITYYIILGWGLPVLVIVPWVMARLLYEDTLCWTTHDEKTKTLLIIRIPTMISILINTVLFIKIAKVLFSKLKSSHSEEARRYQKWAKSTLVLVPLFGIHYAIFLGMSYYMGKNEVIEVTWLICDQLFASFQGFFVAILYCFLNGEVRSELKPRINALFTYISHTICCKFCCTCIDDDFKTFRSRSSVCTMMSSTSVYNGISNRHKTRWEFQQQSKHLNTADKNMEHSCQIGVQSWHDVSPRQLSKHSFGQYSPVPCEKQRKSRFYSNGSIIGTGASTIFNEKQQRCKSEPYLGIELKSMLSQD